MICFGLVQGKLGKWRFKSKTHDTLYEGYMFPLLVEEQLEIWPEQCVRQRIWVGKKHMEHSLNYITNKLFQVIIDSRLIFLVWI